MNVSLTTLLQTHNLLGGYRFFVATGVQMDRLGEMHERRLDLSKGGIKVAKVIRAGNTLQPCQGGTEYDSATGQHVLKWFT